MAKNKMGDAANQNNLRHLLRIAVAYELSIAALCFGEEYTQGCGYPDPDKMAIEAVIWHLNKRGFRINSDYTVYTLPRYKFNDVPYNNKDAHEIFGTLGL